MSWARRAVSAQGAIRKVVCALYPNQAGAARGGDQVLGSVAGELGLRKWLSERGVQLVVTSDKDGPGCEFEREMADADVVISQPFWPAYITRDRLAMAPRLKMCVTAGVGSDHVDLEAACERGVTVAEVTGSNVQSVAEHVVMSILALVRNFVPAHEMVKAGGWDIASCASRSHDLEGMAVGTVAAGRIGTRVLRRLKPFGVDLHYTDKFRLPQEEERELGVTYHETVQDMVERCRVVTINCPLHPETEGLFDAEMLRRMPKGGYLVNTARGKIVDTAALVQALESGHLAGYAGDVWFPQPAPADHPWRSMPHHAMTPHVSGTTLEAQERYAAGTREILRCFMEGEPIRPEYLIAQGGEVVSRSYTRGDATAGAS